MRWAQGDDMLNKSKLALALSLAFTSSFAAANSSPNNIETIVVTANKIEQSIEQALASVQVIDREEIEKLNARDVLTVLETQVGIQVNRNGGQGQNASLFVRGLESRYSLILIDGVRVGSATLGYKSLSTLPLNSVERIEVVKGSRAAQYGSDALAGVINIITRDATGHSVALTTGSHSYLNLQGTSRFSNEYIDLAVNLGVERTKGFDVLQNDDTNAADPDKDGYQNINVGINLAHNNDALGLFALRTQYSSGDVEFDNRWTPESDADETAFENYHVNFNWSKDINGLGNQLDISYSQDQDKTDGLHQPDWQQPVYVDTEVSAFETSRLQLDYLTDYSYSESITLNGGVNWIEEHIDVTDVYNTVYEKDTRTVYSAFAGGYYDDGNVIANAAVRHDDYENIGSEQTYNVAAGIYLHKNAVFRISQSSGFKAPTFNDLYYPGSGNPELRSETSINREIGLRINFEKVHVDVAVYRNELTDKIAWAPDETGAWSPMNIEKAQYQGVEFTSSFDVLGFENNINLSYLDADKIERNESSSQVEAQTIHTPLPFISERSVRYSIAKQWQQVDLTLSAAYQSEQVGTIIDAIPSRIVWDLSANYHITDALKASVRVENVFDKDYIPTQGYGVDLDGDWVNDELYHYNEIGRQVFVGISYQF